MAESKHAAAVMFAALLDTLQSVRWLGETDNAERAWLLLLDLSDALAPISPVHVPTRAQIADLARRLERDADIRREFDGTNYAELAERHRLTSRQIRRITKRRA